MHKSNLIFIDMPVAGTLCNLCTMYILGELVLQLTCTSVHLDVLNYKVVLPSHVLELKSFGT